MAIANSQTSSTAAPLINTAPELWRVPGLIKDCPPEHQRRLIDAATSGQSSDQPWAGGKVLQIK